MENYTDVTGVAEADGERGGRIRKFLQSAGRWTPWVVFAAVLLAYSFFQIRGFTPAYAEIDPDAYQFLAKRIAQGQPLFINTDDPFLYQQHMWVETAPGKVTSKYPPGYPVLMAAGYRLAGDSGMYMVSPIMGGLALIGAWLLFRLWLKPFYSTMAFLTLATLSQYTFYSAYMLSHATSLCLTTWGMYFLWRWLAHPGICWGLAAGLALGATVTVRPTDILFVLPLAVAAGVGLWRGRRDGRIPWVAAGALFAAWGLFVGLHALFNHAQFGSMAVTGYSLSGEQNGFSREYFFRYFGMIVGGLNKNFLPIFFPIGLAGMIMWGPPADRTMRLLWFVPIFLVYSSYYWVNDNWSYLRFFMSTLPVFIGAAYALLERLPSSRLTRVATVLVLLVMYLCINMGGFNDMYRRTLIGKNPRELAKTGEKMAAFAPADAVIFSQMPLCQSLGPRANYTVYEIETFNRGQGMQRFRETDRKGWETEPRRQPERTKRLREFYEKSTDLGLLEMEREKIRSNLKAGRGVFFLLPVYQREAEKQKLGPGFTVKTMQEWDVDWEWWGRTQRQKWGIYLVMLSTPAPVAGN